MRTAAFTSFSFLWFFFSLIQISTSRTLVNYSKHNHGVRAASRFGGFALTASTCPVDTNTCGSSACCPTRTTCRRLARTDREWSPYCCPDESNCYPKLITTPTCADPTWLLYTTSENGYLCCAPDEIALAPSDGISSTSYGRCVPADPSPSATIKNTTSSTSSTSKPTQTTRATTTPPPSSLITHATSSTPLPQTTVTVMPKVPQVQHKGLEHLDHGGGFTIPAIIGIVCGMLFLLFVSLIIALVMRHHKMKNYQHIIEQGTSSKASTSSKNASLKDVVVTREVHQTSEIVRSRDGVGGQGEDEGRHVRFQVEKR